MCAERRPPAARGLAASLALAAAFAGALACGSGSESESRENAEPAAAAGAPATQAPAAPDAAIVPRPPPERPAADTGGLLWLLTLEVGAAQEIEVLSGTPILFSVSLTGAGSGPSERLGGAEKPWYALVALELADTGGPLPWRVLALAPHSLAFGNEAPGASAAPEGDAPEAVIAPGRLHLLTLAIPPEEAVHLPAGRHALRAVVARPNQTGDAARVVSDPVAVVVRERVEDPAAQAALERGRALATADFYVRAGRYGDAQRSAAQLVERDPADAAARVLLGDAAAGLQQNAQARDAYLAALELVAGRGEHDEAPQDLIERLGEVSARLASAEAPPSAATEAP